MALAVGVVFTAACAGSDNPTALDDLEPEVDFDIAADRVETYEEVEIHVRAQQDGSHMQMLQSQLEIQHHDGGAVRTVAMEPDGDGYSAHVMFFDPGEYDMHFSGILKGHRLMGQMGEMEIDAFRHHQVIGPYWVEIEISPGQVLPDDEAHIHLHVFTIGPDGMPDVPASGLTMEVEIHDPAGVETLLAVTEEEAGEYEVQYQFGGAGEYELHVEIDVDGVQEDGEFHIPVLDPEDDDDGQGTGGGHGH
jgi:hypothetical protein